MAKAAKNPAAEEEPSPDNGRFTDGFDDLVERYDGTHPPDPASIPDVLYHYTNASGLHGMLGSGSIWLSHYRYLNDTSEIQHTESLLREVLSAALESTPSDISSKILSQLVDKRSLSSDFDIYIFSLSEQKDSLSQWRGYASEGRGFTMGLDTKELLKHKKKKEVDGGFDLFRVEYDRSRQIKVLKDALQEIIERAEENVSSGTELSEATENAVWCFQFISFTRSVMNKHASFRDENEWRVALIAQRPADTDKEWDSDIKVRVRGSELIPYLVVKPGLKGKLPLRSIGVGPGFSRGNQTNAVRSLCGALGYAPTIYNADTPYTRD